MRDWSPGKFKVLQEFLFQKYGEHGVSVDDLIAKEYDFQKRQARNRNLSADELHDLATEEVVAKSMEKMLSDGNLSETLAELKKSDRSLWQKIKDYIADLAKKIREVYKGLEPDSEEGRMVGRMKDSIEEIQKLFAEGLGDASRNEQAARERGAKAGRAEKNTTREGGVKYSDRYSYDALIQKAPMHITEIDESSQNVNAVSQMSRNDVKKQAKNNAKKFGTVDASGTLRIHVDDNGKDVVIGTKGIEHGLRRGYSRNWLVTLNAGEIIKNSIQINELVPENPDAKASYVLVGAARNQNGEMYIVRTVVDTYSSELNYIEVLEQDVLHAIANKSEEQKNKGQLGNIPSGASANNAFPITGPDISIARLLDYVNEFYPELLPEDVLKHYGYSSRPHGEMSDDVLFQQRGTSRELEAAQRKNEKLQQELKAVKELLKLQGQVTGGKFMTKSSIAEEAKLLMKRYNAAGDSKELASMLDDVYRYIASGDDLTMDGSYFTDQKSYADVYQNPGASSISTGKNVSNPKTFEVYLNIQKPFDITNKEARRREGCARDEEVK